MILLTVPIPPSINHYYGHRGRKMFVVLAGVEYRNRVMVIAHKAGIRSPVTCPCRLFLNVWYPDNRRRDLDNLRKCLQDALKAAKVYADDSQIKESYDCVMGIDKDSPRIKILIDRFEKPMIEL